MHSLRTTLMSGVAAISLVAAPALAQDAATPEAGGGEQVAQGQMDRSYDDSYGGDFAAWGDQTVDELVGTTVINDAGEAIGEIDDFGLAEDQLVAIIGVGGFLGLGEHSVAVPIDQLTTQEDQLVLSGVTREELEAMPEFDSEESQTFAADQTLRSGYEGGMGGGMTDTAAGDAPMAEETMADAPEEAAEPMTGDAGEGEELADVQPAEPADEPGAMAENEAEQEVPLEETDVAETEVPQTPEAGEGVEEMAAADDEPMTDEMETAEAEGGWTSDMDQIFADIADREIAELIGMEVASADGEVVGEIDNFALEGQDVVAIIGVGGFLGIGEHDVALSLGDMTYDGERLVLSSITEEQLRDMPEYEVNEENQVPQDGTLRSTYNQ